MLKLRIFTSIILAIVGIAILFYATHQQFYGITLGIVLLAAWEWSNLIEIKSPIGRALYCLLLLVLCPLAWHAPHLSILWVACAWWLSGFVIVIFYPKFSYWWISRSWIKGIMGGLVVVPLWLATNLMFQQPSGVYLLLYVLLLVVSADIAAYFVGSRWGKTKLLPQVSPGKSFEGLMGALVASSILSLVGYQLFDISGRSVEFIGLALFTGLVSVLGDLVESAMKRARGIKDSGHLLPGHGGVLDRIDSMSASLPIFALGYQLFGLQLL